MCVLVHVSSCYKNRNRTEIETVIEIETEIEIGTVIEIEYLCNLFNISHLTLSSLYHVQSTIRCVCAVIHMHMLEAARTGMVPHRDFKIFEDRTAAQDHTHSSYGSSNTKNSQDDKVEHVVVLFLFLYLLLSLSLFI